MTFGRQWSIFQRLLSELKALGHSPAEIWQDSEGLIRDYSAIEAGIARAWPEIKSAWEETSAEYLLVAEMGTEDVTVLEGLSETMSSLRTAILGWEAKIDGFLLGLASDTPALAAYVEAMQ